MDAPGGGTITHLLEETVRAWLDAGADLTAQLRPAAEAPSVRADLSSLGFDPVPELVELYSWREPPELAGLFWEADLTGAGTAIQVWNENRSVLAGHPDWALDAATRTAWPGPPEWFPALVGVGVSSDCLVVDNGAGPDRGSVWWSMPQDDPRRIFDSIAEALETALYCVRAGLWTHAGGIVECARTHQPWPHDRVHPPWCDQHH